MASSVLSPTVVVNKARVSDFVHVFLYAQRLSVIFKDAFNGNATTMQIDNSLFSISGCNFKAVVDLLICCIWNALQSGLITSGVFVMNDGHLLVQTFACDSDTSCSIKEGHITPFTLCNLLTCGLNKAMENMQTFSIHSNYLWNLHIRWLLALPLVSHCANACIGSAIRVSLSLIDTFDTVYLLPNGVTRICCKTWYWKHSKLRRYLLHGMSMDGDPYDTITASFNHLESYVISSDTCGLTWNMGTQVVLVDTHSFWRGCKHKLDTASQSIMCKILLKHVMILGEAYIVIANVGNSSDILVCDTEKCAQRELRKYKFSKNPAANYTSCGNDEGCIVKWTYKEDANLLGIVCKSAANVCALAIVSEKKLVSPLIKILYKHLFVLQYHTIFTPVLLEISDSRYVMHLMESDSLDKDGDIGEMAKVTAVACGRK